jgi:hypothetical protein
MNRPLCPPAEQTAQWPAAVVAVHLQEGLGHAGLGPNELDERIVSHHREPVQPASRDGQSTRSMTMLIRR